MMLRRYILTFTLALISCAGTKYIHSISSQEVLKSEHGEMEADLIKVNVTQVVEPEIAKDLESNLQLI